MATAPQIMDDPWTKVKPKDVYLNPGFYKLDKDTRAYITSKIAPEWNSWDEPTRKATLDAPIEYWKNYFNPPPDPEKVKAEKFNKQVKEFGIEGFQNLELPPELPPAPDINELIKQKKQPRAKFDAESAGYDYESAKAAGLGPDGTGHWPSRDPKTGLILKGKTHPTWSKTEEGETAAGYKIVKQNGRYYSFPLAASQAQRAMGIGGPVTLPTDQQAKEFQQAQQPSKDINAPMTPLQEKLLGADKMRMPILDSLNRLKGVEERYKEIQSQIYERWGNEGPALTIKEDVDAYNQLAKQLNQTVGELKTEYDTYSQEAQKLTDEEKRKAGISGKAGRSNLASLFAQDPNAVAPEYQAWDIGGIRHASAKWLDEHPGAQIVASGFAQGLSMSQVHPPELGATPQTPGEHALSFVSDIAGSIPAYVYGGKVIGWAAGFLPQIPMVGRYLGMLGKLGEAKRIGTVASKTEEAAGVAAKMAAAREAIPVGQSLYDALEFASTHPKITKFVAVPAVRAANVGSTMAMVGAIQAVGNGQDPKKAALHAYGLSLIGEAALASPPMQALIDKMEINISNPKIAEFLKRIGVGSKEEWEKYGKEAYQKWTEDPRIKNTIDEARKSYKEMYGKASGKASHEIPEIDSFVNDYVRKNLPEGVQDLSSFGSQYVRSKVAEAHPEYEYFRQFLNNYMMQGHSAALGQAVAGATSYGLAAAGMQVAFGPGDIKQRLLAGGEEGIKTFIAVGAFHLPSVMAALRLRAGKVIDPKGAAQPDIDPTEAVDLYSQMSPQERKALVDKISPEEIKTAGSNMTREVGETPTPAGENPVIPQGINEIGRASANEPESVPGTQPLPAEMPPAPEKPAEVAAPELPGELPGTPLTPPQKIFHHWLDTVSPQSGEDTVGKYNAWLTKVLPADLRPFSPSYLKAQERQSAGDGTFDETEMTQWATSEAQRIKEATTKPIDAEAQLAKAPPIPNLEELQKNGVTDEELKQAIGKAWGMRGGWGNEDEAEPQVQYRGGPFPSIKITKPQTKEQIQLTGIKLLEAYRKVYNIPEPGATIKVEEPSIPRGEQLPEELPPTPVQPTEAPTSAVAQTGFIPSPLRQGWHVRAEEVDPEHNEYIGNGALIRQFGPPINTINDRARAAGWKPAMIDQYELNPDGSPRAQMATAMWVKPRAIDITAQEVPPAALPPASNELPAELPAAPTQQNELPAELPPVVPIQKSWRVGVQANGSKEWSWNSIRYATKEEAEAAGQDLFSRWMGADAVEAQPAEGPPTHRWNAEENRDEELSAVPEKLPAELPLAPAEAPAPASKGAEENPDIRLAQNIAEYLKTNQGIDKDAFFALADEAYGGSRAEGKYGPSEAYDALELGINLYIQGLDDAGWRDADLETAHKTIKQLQDLQAVIASQTNRSGNKDLLQQFSTPPAYGYAIARLANIQPGDVVSEPSAGTGDIALQAKKMGGEVYANEIDPRRAALLEQIIPNVTQYDAEQIGNILNKKFKPTVVVMNPPFSHAGTRMGEKKVIGTDRNHIDAALSLLEPGGRLVAIVGAPIAGGETVGMSEWLQKTRSKYNVRANVQIGRDVYKGYGTTFPTRVLIIDKTGPTPEGSTITKDVANLDELIDNLEEVRNDRQHAPKPNIQVESVPAGGTGSQVSGSPSSGGRGSVRPISPAIGPSGTGAKSGNTAEGGAQQPSTPTGPDSNNVELGSQPSTQPAPAAGAGGIDIGGGRPSGKTVKGQNAGGDLGNTGGKSDLEPGGKAADLAGAEHRVIDPAKTLDDTVIFDPYTPTNVTIQGAQKHPASIVESSTMASVPSPRIDYIPDIPESLVKSGVLSDIQLEFIATAGQNHAKLMPDGARYGILLGDGTGVGKGRQLAGVILDNWRRGRRKAIWVSKNKKLFDEAKRDWHNLGQNRKQIHPINAFGYDSIDIDEGILYTTYDTLKSGSKKIARTRLDQIREWLDREFDGVIIYDEAHVMGSLTSQRGIAARALQDLYPKARIVYASATAATEVNNLIFAQRLGLWGTNTPFTSVEEFAAAIGGAGVSAMESTALSLKAMGRYMARSISYNDGTPEGTVEYERMEHKLTGDQILMYDRMADAWQMVIHEIDRILHATRATGRGRGDAHSAFWGAHQRFFNQMITSLQMPTIIERIDRDFAAGNAIVLQLTNTGEAAQERAAANMDLEEELDDFAIDPFDTLINMVQDSFPTQAYEDYVGPNGNVLRRPAYTGGYSNGVGQGEPIQDAAAVEAKQSLLDDLRSMNALMPESPLDMIVNTYGSDRVSEFTGRKRRFTWETQPDGTRKKVEQKRSGDLQNKSELNAFQNDQKQILVFSEGSGGTGLDAHASLEVKNQRKRSHILAQAGWRADSVMQGFGRTHRSNQRQAPGYILAHTDLAGQKRFISSIARRLGQMGALTRGSRQASGGGLFTAADNLESQEALDALHRFFAALYQGDIPDLTIDEFETQTGLQLRTDRAPRHLLSPKDLPVIKDFLNRLLSIKVTQQNKTFEAFDEFLKEIVDAKIQAGTLDQGVETIKGTNIIKLEDRSVYRHETGAEARYVLMQVDVPNKKTTWEKARGYPVVGFAKSNRTGQVWQIEDSTVTETDKQGTVHRIYRLRGPAQTQYVRTTSVSGANYTAMKEPEAKALWAQQYEATPATRTMNHHMITGAVLPIWDRLPTTHNKIIRAQTVNGEIVLGIDIPPTHIDQTLRNLGAEVSGINIDRVLQQILAGAARVQLTNGWFIERAQVQGERRIEILGPTAAHQSQLEKAGAIIEKVGFKYRYFIPTGDNMRKVWDAVTLNRPIAKVDEYSATTPAAATAPTAPQGGGALGMSPQGAVDQTIGQGDVPGTQEQAQQSVLTWLSKAQESIDRIIAGEGTIEDQMAVHQNPVIAKHLLNWINKQDAKAWLDERSYVDRIMQEVKDYTTAAREYDEAQAKAEAMHYAPFVEQMLDELKQRTAGNPEVSEEGVLAMASGPVLPPPPTTSSAINYGPPPIINRADLVSRNDILTELSQKLDAPIRYGRFRQRALGIFKINPQVIRIKQAQDISTAAHEVGHLIHKYLWGALGSTNLDWRPLARYRSELEPIATKPHAGQSKLPEGFAEYIRMWITDPPAAATAAPQFNAFFESELNRLPAIRQAIEKARTDYARWQNQKGSANVLSAIAVETPDYSQLDWFSQLYTGLVNRMHPLEMAVKALTKDHPLSADDDPAVLAQLLNGWAAKAEHFLEHGTFDKRGNIIGLSLRDILKPVKDRLEDLRFTAISLRTLEKKGQQNIEVGITVDNAKQTLKEQGFDPDSLTTIQVPSIIPNNPPLTIFDPSSLRAMTNEAQIIKDALFQLYKYQDDLLAYFRDSGMLDQEIYDKIKVLNQFYVPFHRFFEPGAGEMTAEGRNKASGKTAVNLWQPVKKMPGSWRPIEDPLETIIKNTYTLINIAERNIIGQAVAKLAKIENAGRWVEGPLPPKMVPHSFELERIKNALEKAGVDIDNIDLAQLATIFVPNAIPSPKENTVTVFFDGKPLLYQLEPNLYKTILGLDGEIVGPMVKILSIPASILRAGATGYNPEFMTRNVARDSISAWLQTNVGFTPGYDNARAIAHILNKDDVYLEWLRSGAPHAAMVSMDREKVREALQDMLRSPLGNVIHHPLDAIRIGSEISEAMTRVGVYEAARKQGKSIREAGLISREGTLDFQRMGAWLKAFNLTIPFLNANIQDADKFVRIHKGNLKKALIKGSAIALVSLITYWLNKDDPDYHELPWWQRDLFWLFPTTIKGIKIPGLSSMTKWIPIPKPFIWGLVYANIPERLAEYIDTKDSNAFDQYFTNLFENTVPSVLPTAFKTSLELLYNKNFWQNRDIESQWQRENYAPEYRSNWYTGAFANGMAHTLAMIGIHTSPLKIEHGIFSTTGGTGRFVLKTVVDPLAAMISPPGTGASPRSKIIDIPILKVMAVRYPHASLRSISMVENLWNDINLQYKSKVTSDKEFNRYNLSDLSNADLNKWGILKDATTSMSEINRDIHRIALDPNFNSTQKRDAIDADYMQILRISQDALKQLGIRKYPKEEKPNQIPAEFSAPPTIP